MSFILLFVFGLLTSSLALLSEFLIISILSLSLNFGNIFSLSMLFSLFILASIEELMKGVLLFRYRNGAIFRKKAPLSRLTKIVYALFFGIGFSLLEGLFSFQTDTTLSLLPFLQTTLLHIGTSALLIEAFLSSEQEATTLFSRRNVWYVSSAIGIHLLFNIIVFFQV